MKKQKRWTIGDKVRLGLIFLLAAVIVGEAAYLIKTNQPSYDPDSDMETVETEIEPEETEEAEEAEAEPEEAEETPTDEARVAELDMNGEDTTVKVNNMVIVLDPGHGKSSSLMSAEEKKRSGWKQNAAGAWGEWRHYKIGSGDIDCEGSGCNHRVTPNGACWYPIGNSDRNIEPEINLNNAIAAKQYLEDMGYTVRMTRTSNDENPSITRRLEYCYPDLDKTRQPDAALFMCIHSNAGGARGSAYIQLEDPYDQKWISQTYTEDGNKLGKLCNDKIVEMTSLSKSGPITFEPELIAFCKAPVTCGYLEIGFFDNQSDLAILKSESDKIGKAIAEGIDQYIKERP